MKVGLGEWEIKNENGRYVLYVAGYGREKQSVGEFYSPRAASIAHDTLRKGVVDVAPIIWETGEEAP